MNDHNVGCSDERLLKLLHADSDSDKVCDAEAHLEHCSQCQERLETLAAKPQDWRLAHESLSKDAAAGANDDDHHPRSMWATMRWQRVPGRRFRPIWRSGLRN